MRYFILKHTKKSIATVALSLYMITVIAPLKVIVSTTVHYFSYYGLIVILVSIIIYFLCVFVDEYQNTKNELSQLKSYIREISNINLLDNSGDIDNNVNTSEE